MTTNPTPQQELFLQILKRLDAQNLKGVKRTRAAIDILCGAVMGIESSASKELLNAVSFAATMVACRGADYLKELTKDE